MVFKHNMQIQNINHTNFTSRNKTIRFADDVSRRVNKCYPRISSTLVDDFNTAKHFKDYRIKLYKRIDTLRNDMDDCYDDADSLIGRILAITKTVKEHRIGNCGESALLAEIIAKINGIKDCYIASLKTSKGKNLDHSVLLVNDKKPYIIDAWLGFADFVPNTIKRFQSEFRNHFNIKDGDKLVFKKLEDEYADCLNQDFSRRQINKLKRIYPNHVIKRGYL